VSNIKNKKKFRKKNLQIGNDKITPGEPLTMEYWTSIEGLQIIVGLILDGNDIKDIVKDYMLITHQTFLNWCKKCPELNKIRLLKQDSYDAMVKSALLRSCAGFYENGLYYPPNPKSIALWFELKQKNIDLLAIENNKPQINVSINFDDGRSEEIKSLDKDIPSDENLQDGKDE
jgi:hypothetical protein